MATNDRRTLTNDQRKAAEEAEAIMREAAGRAAAKLSAAGIRPNDEENFSECRECACPEFKPKFSNPFQCRQPGCGHSAPFHMPT